jgi:hypothetical protein
MNLFRLVLCLAGLAIYLVVKQYTHSDALSETMRPTQPASAPDMEQVVPGEPRPQTTPHIEVIKPDKVYVDAKGNNSGHQPARRVGPP